MKNILVTGGPVVGASRSAGS